MEYFARFHTIRGMMRRELCINYQLLLTRFLIEHSPPVRMS